MVVGRMLGGMVLSVVVVALVGRDGWLGWEVAVLVGVDGAGRRRRMLG